MPLVFTRQPIEQTRKEKLVPPNEYPNTGYSHYLTVVLSISSARFYYLSALERIKTEYKIKTDQEESLYDWLVCEALNKTLNLQFRASVSEHYKQDVYKCVYDNIGRLIEDCIHMQFKIHKLQFFKGQKVKVLVAGDSLFLVKGVIPHA